MHPWVSQGQPGTARSSQGRLWAENSNSIKTKNLRITNSANPEPVRGSQEQPGADVQLPSAKFQHPSSRFPTPTSNVQVLSSNFRLPTSNIELPTSKLKLPSWNQESTKLGSQIDQYGGSKSSQLGAGGHLGSKIEFGPILSKKYCNLQYKVA